MTLSPADTPQPDRRRWVPPLIFAMAALCTVIPLMLHGCSCGHDFDFHLLSWMEAASQWQHGILKPVWAFAPAYNAGEPRLLMYPPLSWATGAALGLLLPWPALPAAFTGLVLFLCGLAMYRLLRRWASPAVATLAACLYMVNPYMLFVAYERTAYAELMAAAWMPLLLAAMLRSRMSAWRVAVAVALLWLTNAPAAVVGCYAILLLGVARLVLMRGATAQRLRLAGTVAGGVMLGLVIDAFYLVPMGYERRFVQLAMAILPMARPDANFLFSVDKDAFHTHVLLQASWIGVGVCCVASLCGMTLLLMRRKAAPVRSVSSMHARDAEQAVAFGERQVVVTLHGFSILVLFLLSKWSAPIWHVTPELVFLQFPWRFLTVASAAAVVLLALLLQRFLSGVRSRFVLPAAVFATLLAGWFAGGRYFREACEDDESVQAQREQFVRQDGVGPTDEYTPVNADNDVLPLHLPPAWIASTSGDEPGTRPRVPRADLSQPEDLHFATEATAMPTVLVVRLRQFPGWHTLLDGAEVTARTRRDGLIEIPLPAGVPHRVEVRYRTTADQWAGLGVSAITVLLCGVAERRKRSGIMGPTA